MKSAFSKVITIWLTIVLLIGAVVGINVFANANTVATVDYKNVSYDGQIQLVYYVKSSVADAADGSYVKIRFWREGVVPADANDKLDAAVEKESTLTRTVSGVDYSIYFSGGILPKMMREDVYACTVRYDADGNVLTTGELFKFSVQEYVEKRLAAGSTDAQVELYMALLGYGAAVQEAFDYKTDKLAGKFYDFEGFTASEVSGANKTATVYYNPTAKTYSAAATGAEGEISYVITYTGASVVWDADNYAFTVNKMSEIVSIAGSDGSTSLVYNEKVYTAGDVIPTRTFFYSTDTGTNPRLFASERPGVNLYNPMTLPTDSDILFEFEADILVNKGTGGIANVAYVELYDSTSTSPKATATIQRYYSDKLYFNHFASAANIANTSSNNIIGVAATPVDGAYPTVNYRLVIAKADAENVTVTLYVNGVQAGNVLTVAAFNLDRIKFMFQDDGQDRNSVVTLTNTNFIKYIPKTVEEVNPAEPNTPGLPNVDSDATVTTSEIWGIDNGDGTMTYSTTDNGGTKYLVSYKSSPDIAINSNNTVTYTYNPVITAIKTADGADVPYLTRVESGYDKTQYGVGDTIPHRWFFTENFNGSGTRKFAASGTVVNRLTATRVDVTEEQIDSDLLYLFETDMIIESDVRQDWLNSIFNISLTKSNDTRYATAALAKTRNTGRTNIYPHKLGSGGNVGGYEYSDVKLGDTFTYRIELRKTETAYKAVLIFNGVKLNEVEFDIDAAEIDDVRLYIGSRDDSPYRYNTVTFKNFKWIRYNVVEMAQPDEDEILTPSFLPTENKESTTRESTIYSTTPGTYTKVATGAEGEVAYAITYKNGIDTLVNPDGSVTFSKVATILSIKRNGVETTIDYAGKTYGASGEGVINYIPHHDFFYSTAIGSDNRLFVASTGVIATSSHVYGTYVEGLENNLITLLEFDANFEAVGDAAEVDMLQLVMGNKNGGDGGYIVFSRDANGNVFASAPGVAKFDTGADLGDNFKFRIEVRSTDKAAGNINVRVYINNIKLAEGNVVGNFIRGDIKFNVYDYSKHRNHVVTLNNFKWLRANPVGNYYNN